MTADLNLTRDECAARGAALQVHGYDLHLDISEAADADRGDFVSTSTVRFVSSQPVTWLDLVASEIVSLRVNGQEQTPTYDGARLALGGLADDGERINEVTVQARCRYSRTGEGLHRFTDPVDEATYLYTHFEPTDARRAYACFEQPDLKAPISVTVTAPSSWLVRSNQPVESVEQHDATSTVHFATTPVMSTYLVEVAAGPFHEVTDLCRIERPDGSTQDIPLALQCRASMAEHLDAADVFEITKQGLRFFDEAFGYPYPWGKYDQVFVPEYNIGAMEHPGLVTFSENSFLLRGTPTLAQRESLAGVIMHEMSHMWFGDLATPKWWDDTWLKESFADLMGYLAATEACGFDGPWVSFALDRKQWAYTQDQLPTTHPIVADVPDLEAARQNFDGITYAKGASVIKQLMAYAGREEFFTAARLYFRRHAFGSTTLDDLIACLRETSSADLSDWTTVWLHTAGPSVLTPVVERSSDGRAVSVAVIQAGADAMTGEPVSRPHRVVVTTCDLVDGTLRPVSSTPITLAGERTPVPLPEGTRADLVIVNDLDLTYAVCRLDETSITTAQAHLSSLESTLSRALVWSSLWNLVRDAQLPATRFVDIVCAQAPKESDAALLEMILARSAAALSSYLPASQRDPFAERLIDVAGSGLSAAAPGSPVQRAWAEAMAVLGDAHRSAEGLLRRILDGGFTSLEVTPQLRWDLLAALAHLGVLGEDELHAARDADRTMTGRTSYALVVASQRGADSKHAVWRELVEGTDLTNDHQRALVKALSHASHDEVGDLAPAYFAGVRTWWDGRSQTMAMLLATGLYPAADLADGGEDSNPVVLAADEWLATNADAPASLRKIVIGAADTNRRQLRAQELASRNT
ncbi:aminopeptidase N [Rudaeicoccus suwonensis]|uniref:Aminopeptidase N n=1 Tax=Rudaeicoccus suwonensis TaxID=657409 RepID=A0A561E7U7_9MICO|nr:aminopeptidase N [Rudaeicoccus suwonensis]TWE11687.1 aminopeptidase N [Rudaeicoccus suwonensis]